MRIAAARIPIRIAIGARKHACGRLAVGVLGAGYGEGDEAERDIAGGSASGHLGACANETRSRRRCEGSGHDDPARVGRERLAEHLLAGYRRRRC